MTRDKPSSASAQRHQSKVRNRTSREALLVEELSDVEFEAIRRAEPPPEAELYDHEFTPESGAGT